VWAFLITGLIFPFAYQLVVDRQMSGWKAVKLSAERREQTSRRAGL